MRVTRPRAAGLAWWLAAGLTLLLPLAGCGGGSTASQFVASENGIATCADGTVASYMGTTCSQMPSIVHWTSYSCTSTPSSICAALGPNGSNITMRIDGPHTILVGVGSSGLWNVTAGQRVDVVIQGTVYGATSNDNWPHFDFPGQTGDGTEDNKTTVGCAASGNCIKLGGVSDIPCSNTSPVEYCFDQDTIDAYLSANARFNPAPANQPYPLTIEIKLDGGISGTATLRSVGIHL
jgi:hypothetical protein